MISEDYKIIKAKNKEIYLVIFFFSMINKISDKVRFLFLPLPSGFKSYTNFIILINSSFSNLDFSFNLFKM